MVHRVGLVPLHTPSYWFDLDDDSSALLCQRATYDHYRQNHGFSLDNWRTVDTNSSPYQPFISHTQVTRTLGTISHPLGCLDYRVTLILPLPKAAYVTET